MTDHLKALLEDEDIAKDGCYVCGKHITAFHNDGFEGRLSAAVNWEMNIKFSAFKWDSGMMEMADAALCDDCAEKVAKFILDMKASNEIG